MKKVIVLVYDSHPYQTELFVETFRKVNTGCYGRYSYEFKIVNSTTDYDCRVKEVEKLAEVNGTYRWSFLQKLDDIISNGDCDFIIVADGRNFCINTIENVLNELLYTDDWELCGDCCVPSFDLVFSSNYEVVKNNFVFINFGFAILNPKQMKSNNVELAMELVPDDVSDFPDRIGMNLIYDKKIIECGLCIDNHAHCPNIRHYRHTDVLNVLMDLNTDVEDSETGNMNFAHYFIDKYLDASTGELRRYILSKSKSYQLKEYIANEHCRFITSILTMSTFNPDKVSTIMKTTYE